LALAALGEHLDHPADRVRAVQAGDVAAHDLHPLHLVEHDVLERGRADAGVLDAYAIDQHQGAGAGAATQRERRGHRADAAGLRHLEPGFAAQQAGQVHGLRVADLLLGEHGGMRDGVAQALLRARGGDHYGIFLSKRKRWQERDENRPKFPKHGELPFPRQASPHAGKSTTPIGRYPGLRYLLASPSRGRSTVADGCGLTRLPLRGQHRLPWARPRLRFLFPVYPLRRKARWAPSRRRDYRSPWPPRKIMKYMQKQALLLDVA